MKAQDVYSLITTDKMFECRDFYVRHFGFEVAFQSTIFVQLAAPGEAGGSFSLAFMPPDHPFGTPGRETFDGKGVYVTIQVADAGAVRDRLRAAGVPIDYDLTDEPWGQRRFMTRDPAGVRIDVVQPIEPADGYYDKYLVKEDGKRASEVDGDLAGMTPGQLAVEVQRLRDGIRAHRDATGHDLCWHHPALWGLLPGATDPLPSVPDWPQFLRGCVRYRESLDAQLTAAPRSAAVAGG